MSTGKQRKLLTVELPVEIGGRIQEWIKTGGLGMTEFATIVEKNPVDARKYLDGRLDLQGVLIALRIVGCGLNWLADGDGPSPAPITGEPSLEFESETEKKEVGTEVDRMAKVVRLSSPSDHVSNAEIRRTV